MPHCEKHNVISTHKCVRCTVEKREATMILRFGVANALHSKEIKEKKDKTCLALYGTINPATTNDMEKYGVEHTL